MRRMEAVHVAATATARRGGWPRAFARWRRTSSGSTEEYTRLTPVEHVLRRPGMYIGPTTAQTEGGWVWDATAGHVAWREVRYVPALYKIFDEILVNALDNTQRPSGTTRIDVRIDSPAGTLSVRNNGRGIRIRKHLTEKVIRRPRAHPRQLVRHRATTIHSIFLSVLTSLNHSF